MNEIALDAAVRAGLEKAKGDWQAIAEESEVSYSWLSKFVNGHIENPGIETLRKIKRCLDTRGRRAKVVAA